MFGEIICSIQLAFSPKHMELFLLDSVADPIKAHVDGFGAALLYGVVGDACCCCADDVGADQAVRAGRDHLLDCMHCLGPAGVELAEHFADAGSQFLLFDQV